MPVPPLPEAFLENVDTKERFPASDLWRQSPCVLLAFRRAGCVLCRDEAQKMWRLKQKLSDMGVQLYGILHEAIDEQVRRPAARSSQFSSNFTRESASARCAVEAAIRLQPLDKLYSLSFYGALCCWLVVQGRLTRVLYETRLWQRGGRGVSTGYTFNAVVTAALLVSVQDDVRHYCSVDAYDVISEDACVVHISQCSARHAPREMHNTPTGALCFVHCA
jgi:AhpC/TSA family